MSRGNENIASYSRAKPFQAHFGSVHFFPFCYRFSDFLIIKAGFHMIADDRGSQIAESSAIVCDHMETHFCDRLRSCDHDRRRSQKIEPCSIFCDRLRFCDHMESKVLRSAIETYPIIFLNLTDDSTPLGLKA